MRRATAAVIGTMAGTALLVGAKVATQPAAVSAAEAGDEAAAAGDAGAADPGATAGPSGSVRASAGPAASATTGTVSRGTPRAGTSTAAAPKTSATTVSCATYTGNTVAPVYEGAGSIAVTINVCGGVVKSASARQVDPSHYAKNASAVTTLNSLAVKYYKTNMSAIQVSGATYTSTAYRTSLKSALGKAGL